MPRAIPEVLDGSYIALIKNRLKANEEIDPAKWALWKLIWECGSFEQLARRAQIQPIRTELGSASLGAPKRSARKHGWICKVDNNVQQ